MEDLLWWLDGFNLATVGIGSVGPHMPALRHSTLDPKELSEDFWGKYWSKRTSSGQAWHPRRVDATNAAEVARRTAAWRSTLGPWQPARHPSLCMSVAAGRRVHASGVRETAERHDLEVELTSHKTDRYRSRTVERMVARGDALWGRAGAWPWAVFIDETGVGTMPSEWWKHEQAATALEDYLRREAVAAQQLAESIANTARVLRWATSAV